MTIELNSGNFEGVVSRGIALVNCWTSGCPACEAFGHTYRRAAAKHRSHVFSTLDTRNEPALRTALGIEHVPTLLLFRDGILLFEKPGSFDEAALDDIVAQAESLDMNLVRAALDSEAGASAAPPS